MATFSELNPGQTWINRELSEIHIDQLESQQNAPAFLPKVAEIQSDLISKISVEPSSLDSYFHLAGTSYLVFTHLGNKIDFIKGTAYQNLSSAYQFAQDLSPADSRTLQIQKMWYSIKNKPWL